MSKYWKSRDVIFSGNISYGEAQSEKLDLYKSKKLKTKTPTPLVFMVHGGGWKNGDKNMTNTVDNKAKYFLSRGYSFISINYPMENVDPEEEVQSVGKALAYVQKNAKQLNIDPSQIVIMGHSA